MRPRQTFHTTVVAILITKHAYCITLPAIMVWSYNWCLSISPSYKLVVLLQYNLHFCTSSLTISYQQCMLLKATTVGKHKESSLCMFPGVHCAYILQNRELNDQPLAAWRHPIHIQTLVTGKNSAT